jgi:hypothetical protein
MKTLKSKRIDDDYYIDIVKGIDKTNYQLYLEKDVKEHLNNFHNDYWKKSYQSDKNKKHITCDELDYLMNKHFGDLVEIKTLQDLK